MWKVAPSIKQFKGIRMQPHLCGWALVCAGYSSIKKKNEAKEHHYSLTSQVLYVPKPGQQIHRNLGASWKCKQHFQDLNQARYWRKQQMQVPCGLQLISLIQEQGLCSRSVCNWVSPSSNDLRIDSICVWHPSNWRLMKTNAIIKKAALEMLALHISRR